MPKLPLIVAFFFLIPLPLLANALYCEWGGYNFSGVYFSDQWLLTVKEGQAACEDRKMMDAIKLSSELNENKAQINALIEKMLKEPRCESSHKSLEKYKKALEAHLKNYISDQQIRQEWLKENGANVDVQRTFAHMQYFNTFCASKYTTISSLLDLEFINLLPVSKDPVIPKEGETVENCSSVRAGGSDNLNSFKVSTEKAKGTELLIRYEFYGMPDQIIVKNGSGEILHDTGCRSTNAPIDIKIPLGNVGTSKILSFDVKQNCEGQHSGSFWDFDLQCEVDNVDNCHPEKIQLTELLKKEVTLNKNYLDMNVAELGCLAYLDNTILPALYGESLIKLLEGSIPNPMCKLLDDLDCQSKEHEPILSQKANVLAPPVGKMPASEEAPVQECPPRPGIESSVLDLVSWNYCSVGRGRLEVK